MKEKKEIKPNHPLRSRRDFLAQGLITASAYAMAPTLYTLLRSPNAFAQQNCVTPSMAALAKTPVIMIDLAGGANIAGSNVIVGGTQGQNDFLADYSRLGLPATYAPGVTGMINEEFGLKFHSMSAMLAGMKAVTSATTRAKCEGIVFCATSSDDTSNNPHNPIFWLNKAGAMGDLIQTIGTSNGRSGGNSQIPPNSFDPTAAPVPISRPEDTVELVSLGRVDQVFNINQSKKILNVIERMSESKLLRFSQKSLPDQVKEVVRCGYSQDSINQRVHATGSRYAQATINPTLDTAVTAVYNNINDTANSDDKSRQRVEASIAKLVIDGYSGAGTISMGGFDYHNNPRSATDLRDFQAGQAIGRILELAARKQKDVAVYVFTDGAVSSKTDTIGDNDPTAQGKYQFVGDDGEKSASFMIVYRNAGRPELQTSSLAFTQRQRQVGSFKSDQNVDKSLTVTSNNVTNLAKSVVLNYLALHGEESRLEEIVGDDPFSSDRARYLLFKKK